MTHAAELDSNDIVIRVIVGAPEWAPANFGGTWAATMGMF